jgi:hypothetical protein
MLKKITKRSKTYKRLNRRTERYHKFLVDLSYTEYYKGAVY